ncbi:MAG: DUF2127 domain-containing protein [Hyphomicrobiales bacterium]|nr:DUF2127 domain-containing protein [Hyphomicrobiales bacterium]
MPRPATATEKTTRETIIRRVFRFSLVLKAVHAVIFLLAGLALQLASSDEILRLARAVTRHALERDPDNHVANLLLHLAQSFSIDRQDTAVIYLLSHGVVELFLVVAIWRKRPWAYPLFMAALALLVAYQCYELILGFSWLLAWLTVFDTTVIWLIWHEYRRERATGVFDAGSRRHTVS